MGRGRDNGAIQGLLEVKPDHFQPFDRREIHFHGL